MKKFLLLLTALGPLFLRAGTSAISLEDDVITVRSPRLEMKMKGGLVVGLTDLKTGEVFAAPPPAGVPDQKLIRDALLPGQDAKPHMKTSKSGSSAEVTYEFSSGTELIYEFTVDGDDILVRQKVKKYDMMQPQNRKSLEIHIPFMKPEAVITGMGSRTLRGEEARTESLLWPGSGFFFPRAAVAEGKKGVIFVFNECALPYHNIKFVHTPEHDHFVLISAVNDLMKRTGRPLQFQNGDLDAFSWRISAHENWLEAARSWRSHFERYSGAVPLWKNPAPIVRNAHAFFTGTANEGWKEEPDDYYKRLAARFNPENVVLLYWNADSFVVLGDNNYRPKPFPSLKAVEALKKNGFRWMGFHGFALLHGNDERVKARYEELSRRKLLPENYVFTPSWQGKPEDFIPVMTKWGYGDKGRVWTLLQPAAKDVEDYICYSIPDLAKRYGAEGFYLDVTAEVQYGIRKNLLVVDGKTYNDGEIVTFARLRKEHPEIAFMTEYSGEWCIPYAFWHWVGLRVFDHKGVRINHPFRAALYGSYCWTRETTNRIDPVKCVLWNTMPEIVWSLGEKKLEAALTDYWYIERAKMFVDNKLFNDLPKKWEEGVLGYYRTDGTDKWITFREMPFGYAYVKDGKVLLGMYHKTDKGLPGFGIQSWAAYDAQGRAIGLNPEADYRFVPSSALAEDVKNPMTVTALDDGVYCREFRSGRFSSTVFLESSGSRKETGVSVSFATVPLRVYANGVLQKEGTTKFNVTLPGSIVAVWSEPAKEPKLEDEKNPFSSARPGYMRNAFEGGLNDVNGTHASVGYRGWAYNWDGNFEFKTIDNVKKLALTITPARFIGYRQCLITVPAEKPVLRFDLARLEENKEFDMVARVLVNGVPVWSEDIPRIPAWSERRIDLSAFAGQKILLTFEYAHKDPKRADATARKANKLVFGDIRFTEPDKGKEEK